MNVRVSIFKSVAAFALCFAPYLTAHAQDIQFNVIYQCAPPLSAKVFSCSGTQPTAPCDVQNYRDGKSIQRGVLLRQMLMVGLRQCHLQTAAEAKAHPAGPDLPLNQNMGARRPAAAPAAAVPAAAKAQAPAPAPAPARPAAPASQAGQPPKPGAVSCAGKFEGRYSSDSGAGGLVTITFRSGKATVREPDMVMSGGKLSGTSSEKEAECWTGGGKIYLRWLDGSNYDFPIDINDDGTLDTQYGELKKKGN